MGWTGPESWLAPQVGRTTRYGIAAAPHSDTHRKRFPGTVSQLSNKSIAKVGTRAGQRYSIRTVPASRFVVNPLGNADNAGMANSDFVIVILAAGKGTRLKSALAKVLHRAGGRPLVEHVVRACQPLKPREIVAVVGHQAEDVTAAVAPLGVKTVLQEPQRGTGHAMLVARRAISSRAKFAIVLPGDAPLIRTETLAALARAHRESGAAATILSAEIENPAGYGRIVRQDDGSVSAIVEDSALTGEQRAIREINSSIYCFTLEKLWPCLAALKPQNVHKELYLTDAIAVLRQKGEKVQAVLAADPDEVLGLQHARRSGRSGCRVPPPQARRASWTRA